MRLYDITHPVSESLAVWPGDEPYRFRLTWKRADGASVNVGAVSMSVHTGTHADAPFHFTDAGAGIGALDLQPFLGPARVIHAPGRTTLGPDLLAGLDVASAPRLLFRTDAWLDVSRFPESVPVLAPEMPDLLGSLGVLLVGVDVPSVDLLDSEDLPVHHALTARGIRILESLRLRDVPGGVYELIAVPLRLENADGSPVRALLRG